jgi:hypothetical protein
LNEVHNDRLGHIRAFIHIYIYIIYIHIYFIIQHHPSIAGSTTPPLNLQLHRDRDLHQKRQQLAPTIIFFIFIFTFTFTFVVVYDCRP